jgi:hypothetical protein
MPLSYPAKVNDLDAMKLKFDPNGAIAGLTSAMVKEVLKNARRRNIQREYFSCVEFKM